MEALGIEPTDTPPSVTNLSQEEIAELFDKVDRRYCREEENLSKLLEHQAGLISQSRTLGGFPFQSLKLETVRNLSQLCIEAGVLRSDAIIRARQTLGSRIHQMEKAGFSQCLGHGAQVPVEDQDIHFYHSVRKEHGEGLG